MITEASSKYSDVNADFQYLNSARYAYSVEAPLNHFEFQLVTEGVEKAQPCQPYMGPDK